MRPGEEETLSVVVERDIPHPREKVWRALTRADLIGEWLMRTDFRPEIGRAFTLTGEWGSLSCEVLAIEEFETLTYSWNHANPDPAFALESVVTFTLTPTPTGTRLRMEQRGFRPYQKQAFAGAKTGWADHLANLERAVARLD